MKRPNSFIVLAIPILFAAASQAEVSATGTDPLSDPSLAVAAISIAPTPAPSNPLGGPILLDPINGTTPASSGCASLRQEIVDKGQELDALLRQKSSAQQLLQQASLQRRSLMDQVQTLLDQIRNLTANGGQNNQDPSTVNQQILLLNDQVDQLNAQIDALDGQIKEFNDEISDCNSKIDALLVVIKNLLDQYNLEECGVILGN